MASEHDANQVDDRLLQDDDSENLGDAVEQGNGDTAEEDSALLDGEGEVEGEEEDLSGAGGEEGSFADVDESGDVENDPEVLALKAQLKAMEQEGEKEAERLRQMETEAQLNMSGSNAAAAPTFLSQEEKKEIDARSIYVGNVDYGATAEELEQHFHGCGSINRVTINCDKFSGHPKGFAYIEFAETDGVDASQAFDESLFRGRQIKVVPKRTNVPGHSTTNRGVRGRGGFRGRPPFRGYNPGYRARPRGGYRGGFRGRGRYVNYYSPY